MNIFFITLLFFCGSAFGQEIFSTKLKVRQPNWRLQVLEVFPDGSPKEILFLEPVQGLNIDIPVKLMFYSSQGQLLREMDVCINKEASVPYIAHGPSVIYNSQGSVESIRFYNQGILFNDVRTYYPDGQLSSVVNIKEGVYEGLYERFYENGDVAERTEYIHGKMSGLRTLHYLGDKKAASAHYKDDLLVGEVNEWYLNGKHMSTAYYHQGLLNGNSSHLALSNYHPNGQLAEMQDFRQGQPVGPHTVFFPDGSVSYKVNYVLGKKQGIESSFNEAGKLIFEGEYQDGRPIGQHKKFFNDGQLQSLAIYHSDGTLLEPIKEYYPLSGHLKSQYRLDSGVLDGEFLEWDPDGVMHRMYFYRDGLFEGIQKEFYPTKGLKIQAIYTELGKQGAYEEWFEDGTPSVSISYDRGVRHGRSQVWYKNGQKAIDGFFQEGKPQGVFQEWFEDGSLAAYREYVQGQIDGTEKTFYSNGKLQKICQYIKGRLEGDFLSWLEDGSPLKVMHFSRGTPIGEHLIYYSANENQFSQIARMINYQDGKLHGEQMSFYPNGQKHALMNYRQGFLHGKKTLWNQEGIIIEDAGYIDGALDGRLYIHKSDGSEVISHYENNILSGSHQIFYPMNEIFGKIKALEANYINGQLEGEVIEYNQAGTKISSTPYVKGLKEGTVSVYSYEGKLMISAEFHEDNQNGMAYEYHPNGLMKKQVLFVDDQKEGEEKITHSHGQISAINPYSKGVLNGTAKQWNKASVLIFEADYVDGKRHGRFNKYNDDGEPLILQIYENDVLVQKNKVHP